MLIYSLQYTSYYHNPIMLLKKIILIYTPCNIDIMNLFILHSMQNMEKLLHATLGLKSSVFVKSIKDKRESKTFRDAQKLLYHLFKFRQVPSQRNLFIIYSDVPISRSEQQLSSRLVGLAGGIWILRALLVNSRVQCVRSVYVYVCSYFFSVVLPAGKKRTRAAHPTNRSEILAIYQAFRNDR